MNAKTEKHLPLDLERVRAELTAWRERRGSGVDRSARSRLLHIGEQLDPFQRLSLTKWSSLLMPNARHQDLPWLRGDILDAVVRRCFVIGSTVSRNGNRLKSESLV